MPKDGLCKQLVNLAQKVQCVLLHTLLQAEQIGETHLIAIIINNSFLFV